MAKRLFRKSSGFGTHSGYAPIERKEDRSGARSAAPRKELLKRVLLGNLVMPPGELADGAEAYWRPIPRAPGASKAGYKVLYAVAEPR